MCMCIVHGSVFDTRSIWCMYRDTVCLSERTCNIVEALSSKRPSQEGSNEDNGSDSNDETVIKITMQ